MNWQFTKVKIIISIVVAVVLFLITKLLFTEIGPHGFQLKAFLIGLFAFMIGFLLIYTVWSLIQKDQITQ